MTSQYQHPSLILMVIFKFYIPHHPMHMNVFVDRTEWNLEDLDYIPTEKLFFENIYKKMVNI